MSTSFRWLFLLVLFFVPIQWASAQATDATLTGVVTDSLTGVPLPGVNVFIAGSTQGSITDGDGRYRITSVPLGTLRLYVSSIGWNPAFQDIFLRTAGEQRFDFQLSENIYELGEITVTSDNKKWKQQLEKFTRLFIGETPNAEQTKIVNPEVLDFSAKGGEFKAQASEPLIIENTALGYRIQYFLKDFVATPNRTKYDGEPLFDTMPVGSPEQAAQWNEAREAAFYGSFRHFMLALINNRVEEQGFKIYSRPATQRLGGGAAPSDQRYPLDASKILKPGNGPDERILEFDGFVEIVYTRETEDQAYLDWLKKPGRPKFRSAMIQAEKGPALVDLKGDVLDPYGVTLYWYLAFERVADEVPKEYRPWLEAGSN